MSENRFPSQKLDQYMLRFPDGLRDRIKAAAEANKRSMNQEIIALLEEKFPEPSDFPESLMERIREKLGPLDERTAKTVWLAVDTAVKLTSEAIQRGHPPDDIDAADYKTPR